MIIPVIDFDGVVPSVAYTDYSAVYVSTSLSGAQRDTALKHEHGHIWLQHRTRGGNLREVTPDFDARRWNIAADMEIAKHLYDAQDLEAIAAPRSSLAGGITQEHCAKYPQCSYAEEFYENLVNESEEASHDGEANGELAPGDLAQEVEAIVAGALEELKDLQGRQEQMRRQKTLDNFLPPRPSFASLLDRHLGRAKRSRTATYRRPSRLPSSDLIKKGVTSALKSPALTVFVDRSGSFSPSKTAQSLKTLHECLLKYRGRVECDVLYFADRLMTADPGRGGGGTNYQCVVDQIARDRAKLAVVITDDDSSSGVQVPRDLPNVVVVAVGCASTSLSKTLRVPEVAV